MRPTAILAFVLCCSCFAAEDWGPVQFLIGHWKGEGTGAPGEGSGAFSFTPDVQGRILVRKSFAEYPPRDGRPAFRHDDLMVVFHEGDPPRLRAVFFDNEGHVIRYDVTAAGNGAVFTSDSAGGPRFRLTYTSTAADRLNLKFEIAPPGKDFATYLASSAHRE